MTEEEIEKTPILNIIHMEDFFNLQIATFEGIKYWEIGFRGKRKAGEPFFYWGGRKGMHETFMIYKKIDNQ